MRSATANPLALAATGAIIAIRLTWHWKLQTGANVDFSPSMHWPDPVATRAIDPDRGPVLVTIEYHIDPTNRRAFLHAADTHASAAGTAPTTGAYSRIPPRRVDS